MAKLSNKQLTEEQPAPASRRKVVLSLIGALLLLAAANALASRMLSSNTPNRGYWLVRAKWQLLLHQEQPVDWLILGDSSCNQGVRPDLFDAAMGGRSLNLCTTANMLSVNDAWMLQQYLQNHPKPKGVVVVHVYDMWARGAAGLYPVMGVIPLEWGYWRRLEPTTQLGWRQQLTIGLTRYAPLYGQNRAVGKWLHMPGLVFRPQFTHDAQGYMRRDDADPAHVGGDFQNHVKHLEATAEMKISVANQKGLEVLRKISEQHELDIHLATSPMFRGLVMHRAFRKRHRELRRLLKPYFHGARHFHHALPQPVAMKIDKLENVDHVTHEGAASYTRRLTRVLRSKR